MRINEVKTREVFEEAVENHKQEFDNFFMARLFGLEISYLEDECLIELEIEDFMLNPQGTLHGGVITFAMDVSMGHLLNHAYGPGVTLEVKVQFLKSVKEGRIRIKGKFLKRGRNICFMYSEVHDSEENLLAFSSSTWKVL